VGSALHELGRTIEALESYDEALAINPHFAQALNKRGIALFALERNDDALDSYDKAITADPKLADAYNNRGIVLHELERHADALESHDRALAIDPTSWIALMAVGLSWVRCAITTGPCKAFPAQSSYVRIMPKPLPIAAAPLQELCRFPDALADLDAQSR